MKSKEHLKTIDPAVLDAALNKILGGFQRNDSDDKKAVVIAQSAFNSFFHS
jgi:hypothetical protein